MKNDEVDLQLPPVNGEKKGKSKVIPLIFITVTGLFLLYIVFGMASKSPEEIKAAKKEAEDAERFAVTGKLPAIDAPAPPTIAGVPLPPMPPTQDVVPSIDTLEQGKTSAGSPGHPLNTNGEEEKPQWLIIKERRMGGQIAAAFEPSGGSAQTSGAKPAPAQPGAQDQTLAMLQQIYSGNGQAGSDQGDESSAAVDNGFGSALTPMRTSGAAAALVFDRNLLLAKGSFLDCTLETRLDSTVPGMTSCVLARNVYSDNGKVLLLERGSRVIGEYTGGIKQGAARIFVLWTRVQTPQGVVINIDSPGTDGLGASGLDGYVDTQFWKRFGGAIMLSLIDDAAALATRNSERQDQFTLANSQQAAQEMAAEALKNSINIPPILRKNHGDHLNIYVARDLDFRTVYALRKVN